MPIYGNVVIANAEKAEEAAQKVVPVEVEVTEVEPYLFINGRKKKLSRASAYLLDMLCKESSDLTHK